MTKSPPEFGGDYFFLVCGQPVVGVSTGLVSSFIGAKNIKNFSKILPKIWGNFGKFITRIFLIYMKGIEKK